jgi:hypothetical protein
MSTESCKARLEMATKGPWTIQPLNMDKFPESEFGYPQRIVANDDGLVLVAECLQEPLTPDNARLIVHAPTDLAAALRVIEAAKEVRVAWAAWGGDFTDTAGVARFFLAISHLVEHDDAWEATP